MEKKIILLFLLLYIIFNIGINKVFSSECSFEALSSNSSQEAIDKVKRDCENDIQASGQKINDLDAQIQGMSAKINLTLIQIQQTEQKIVKTEDEIENLSSKIEGLDDSLNRLLVLFQEKAAETYRKRDVSWFTVLFDTNNATDFINQVKYIKTVQDSNQKLIVQVQQAKLNYEDQKKLREKKKVELDELKLTLNEQRNTLNLQKVEKQKWLNDFKNDQRLYQQVLAQAQKQLSAFKSFVQTSGVDVISPNALGSGLDNSYYSQRDSRWAYKTIGYSSENVLNVGCLLTSVAMVATKYGQTLTPLDIASDVNRFYGSTAYMSLPWKSVAGKTYYSGVNVDEELQNGNYVIVGVGGCGGYGGSHFIVLTKKDGDDYIMHDPIYGPDLKLSSHYSNYFCSAATFK